MKQLSIAICFLPVLIFALAGCSILQQPSIVEIEKSRLSCIANPEIIDGDLDTVSELGANMWQGIFLGRHQVNGTFTRPNKIMLASEYYAGEWKKIIYKYPGTIIQLDKPTYIIYVDIYSEIETHEIMLFAAEAKCQKVFNNIFDFIRTPCINIKVGEEKVKRFRIGRKIKYLKLQSDWHLNSFEELKFRSKLTETWMSYTPLRGPLVKEIKFYTIGSNE